MQTPLVRARALDARRALLTSAAARDVPTRASTPPFFSADALLHAPLRCCVISPWVRYQELDPSPASGYSLEPEPGRSPNPQIPSCFRRQLVKVMHGREEAVPRPVCIPRSVAVSFWRTAAEREPGLKQNQVLPFKGLSMLLSFFLLLKHAESWELILEASLV